jgi:transporter family protein
MNMLRGNIEMFEFAYGLLAAFFSGASDTLSKLSISEAGRHKSLVYSYLIIIIFLVIGFVIIRPSFSIDASLLPAFIVQIVIGAIAVAALFKALEKGKASILAPLSSLYILVVIGLGALFLNEHLSAIQLAGGLLVLASSIILSIENRAGFRFEAGVPYLVITILGWGYYYTFIKLFLPALGPYTTTLFTESGIAILILAFCIIRRNDISVPKGREWRGIAGRGIVLFASSLLYIYSVDAIGASMTSIVVAASPLSAIVLSRIILGEKLDLYKYAAALAIVAGLLLIFSG